MSFPTRIAQHKSESDSFAILLYKLKDLGIFRNLTQNDYGIDLEIELTKDDKVIGKYFKAQVKSSQELNIRVDGAPTVGNIKQSTLNYWAELSFHSHIIAFAVDLKTERIYVSKPLFWQSINLIDESKSTKTIEFINKNDTPINSIKLIELIKNLATQPCIHDQIFAHKSLLYKFEAVIDTFFDCLGSDIGSEILVGNEAFITLLNSSKILLSESEINSKIELQKLQEIYKKATDSHYQPLRDYNETDINNIFDFKYYLSHSYHMPPDINAKDALMALTILLPKIGVKLQELREIILKAKAFWTRRDPEYLSLVLNTKLPSDYTPETLKEYNQELKRNKYDYNDDDF